ncbi:MAG: deoxyribodipyrimidine photo-lyase [Victivallales bacterium]|nr:deoxyribodipyrimidine photo-lyase [Victivallales bacterium]
MMDPERIRYLNDLPVRAAGRYVLYWMQAAQRVAWNPALEYAVAEANRRHLPLVVYFGLAPAFPEATRRSYAFMLEGLAETRTALAERNLPFILRLTSPPAGAIDLAAAAALVVADCGYTRLQRQWRAEVARHAGCPVVQIEGEVVVPVAVASTKEEYMARTLRPKLNRQLAQFLRVPEHEVPQYALKPQELPGGIVWTRPDELLTRLHFDRHEAPSPVFRGGYRAARSRLQRFLATGLPRYDRRNDPLAEASSRLSPYLHFGQISPLETAWRAQQTGAPECAAFLEELIVRRELAINYVVYNPDYERFAGLPDWARANLERHRTDRRPYDYDPATLEHAATHDAAWNAAQRELLDTGYMAGYLRMYWGKKILEWSADPAAAFRLCLELNNRYQLDGRDPNSYTGVAWCFGKHDRPWPEHPVFGTVRTMTRSGMARKFDLDAYIRRYGRSEA